MKRIFMIMTAVAMLASCSKDVTTDLELGVNDQNGVVASKGVTLVATLDDVTRVTITGDTTDKCSKMNWEVGDEVVLAVDGKLYTYVASTAGRTTEFAPKDADNAFVPTDLSKPVAAFYNVSSVDAANLTAVFGVAEEQVAGELSNKMPLYAYTSTTVVENNQLVMIMKPLASVIELELGASKAWNVDAVSVGRSGYQKGTYAWATGAVVNAATGAISLETAEVGDEVKVSLGALKDVAATCNVQAVVMGVTREVTVTETVTNEDQTTTEVTKTELYAPLYHGKAVVKLYKNGAENARRTIWADYAPGATAVDEHKHIYQPIKDVLSCKVADGISTAEQFKAFADAVNNTIERYPAGAEFSNEDGVVVLKNSIDLSAYTNWMAIGCSNDAAQTIKPQFVGIFDGGNNVISGLTINHNANDYVLTSLPTVNEDGEEVSQVHNSAALFGVLANGGVIKNLKVEGTIVENMTYPTGAWSYAAGVVAQVSGGTVENCTSEVLITAGELSNAKCRVGGVVARAYATTADITIKNCKNQGDINLSYPTAIDQQSIVGGVIGYLADGSEGCTPNVEDCSNEAAITLFNSGTNSNVGGVFGYINRSSEEAGVLKNCSNTGDVTGGSIGIENSKAFTFSVGGVAGRQNFHTLYNCVNEGAISLAETSTSLMTVNVAGIVGLVNAGENNVAYIEKCTNKGPVTVKGVNTIASGLCAGGVVGYAQFRCKFTECNNQGDVYVDAGSSSTQVFSGAFAGKVGASGSGYDKGIWFDKCVNDGSIKLYGSTTHTGWSYGGGIAGALYGGTNVNADGTYGIHLTGCKNNGVVSILGGAKFRAGGVAGLCNSSAIYDSENAGVVAMERSCQVAEYMGGIAGQLEGGYYSVISGCTNSGTVCSLYKTARELNETTSNVYLLLGGIIGNGGDAKSVIDNCTNTGKLLAAHDGTLEYDEAKTNWVVNQDTTVEYRAAIAGYPNKALPIKNCKIGGSVGVVKGGDGADKYEASVEHKLNNTAGDTYYWERWIDGYSSNPPISDCSFVE